MISQAHAKLVVQYLNVAIKRDDGRAIRDLLAILIRENVAEAQYPGLRKAARAGRKWLKEHHS